MKIIFLNVIDLSFMRSTWNRAIIETLYSYGLRVSELINLKIIQTFFRGKEYILGGKGNKTTSLPISKTAMKRN